jgi:hypothetical protein
VSLLGSSEKKSFEPTADSRIHRSDARVLLHPEGADRAVVKAAGDSAASAREATVRGSRTGRHAATVVARAARTALTEGRGVVVGRRRWVRPVRDSSVASLAILRLFARGSRLSRWAVGYPHTDRQLTADSRQP